MTSRTLSNRILPFFTPRRTAMRQVGYCSSDMRRERRCARVVGALGLPNRKVSKTTNSSSSHFEWFSCHHASSTSSSLTIHGYIGTRSCFESYATDHGQTHAKQLEPRSPPKFFSGSRYRYHSRLSVSAFTFPQPPESDVVRIFTIAELEIEAYIRTQADGPIMHHEYILVYK